DYRRGGSGDDLYRRLCHHRRKARGPGQVGSRRIIIASLPRPPSRRTELGVAAGHPVFVLARASRAPTPPSHFARRALCWRFRRRRKIAIGGACGAVARTHPGDLAAACREGWMRFRKLATLPVIAMLLLIGSARVAGAEEVSIMVGGIEKQIYLPLMLAQRLGYFSDEGLEVEILSEPAGVEAADEMLAGAVQGVVGFYDHNIELQALGKYTESVVQFGQAPAEVEMVSNKHPEIKSFADLKGKNIGVTGLGSSTDFLTEYLLIKAGLKLSDVTPVPVGAGDTLIAAMQHDQIQAAMTTEPTVSRLLRTGLARILVDTRTLSGTVAALGGTYPAA